MSPTLPLVSLAALEGCDAAAPEIRTLHDACIEHGFLLLNDHGIAPATVSATLAASRAFFALPDHIKRRYGHDAQVVRPQSSRGYIPMYAETLHETVGPDPKQCFDLGFEQPLSNKLFTGPTTLPDEQTAPGFARAHEHLREQVMRRVTPCLTRALALALGRPANFFDPYFTEPTLIQRVLEYPAHHGAAGMHTDSGIFTILMQELLPSPSLRVYTRGAWIDVPSLPGTFVINLGDLLQRWTNGRFVSTPHEVKHDLAVSRTSLAFFVYPNIDAAFTPLEGPANERVSVSDMMMRNFDSIWVEGTGAGRARELSQ